MLLKYKKPDFTRTDFYLVSKKDETIPGDRMTF